MGIFGTNIDLNIGGSVGAAFEQTKNNVSSTSQNASDEWTRDLGSQGKYGLGDAGKGLTNLLTFGTWGGIYDWVDQQLNPKGPKLNSPNIARPDRGQIVDDALGQQLASQRRQASSSGSLFGNSSGAGLDQPYTTSSVLLGS